MTLVAAPAVFGTNVVHEAVAGMKSKRMRREIVKSLSCITAIEARWVGALVSNDVCTCICRAVVAVVEFER